MSSIATGTAPMVGTPQTIVLTLRQKQVLQLQTRKGVLTARMVQNPVVQTAVQEAKASIESNQNITPEYVLKFKNLLQNHFVLTSAELSKINAEIAEIDSVIADLETA